MMYLIRFEPIDSDKQRAEMERFYTDVIKQIEDQPERLQAARTWVKISTRTHLVVGQN